MANLSLANVIASIDRSMIASDETFTLVLTSDSVFSSLNPDLGPLQKDFEVVGSSNASSVNIINGKQTSKQQVMITLMPKRTGHLVIPALTVGKDTTKPLYINVKPPLQVPQSQRNLFIETSLNTNSTYPQVQNVYTIKVFYDLNSLSGNLSLPKADGLHFEPLGNQTQYTVHRNHKIYQVVERRYVVFANKPGTYKITGVDFMGQTAGGGNSLFQLTGGKPVHAEGNPVTLTVKPEPQHQGAWLPAQQLSLTQQWTPNPPKFRVGDPITRTITITANGLTAHQLPDIQMPNLTNVNSYPEQPIMQTTNNGQSLQGQRIYKVAYIPTQAGNINFPAITVRWWNTKTNQFQTAKLPAQHFTIVAASNQAATAAVNAQPNVTTPAKINTQITVPQSHYDLWAWLAGIFFLAWVVTLAYFWLRKRGQLSIPIPTHNNLRNLRNQLKQACEQHNAHAIKQALLNWAKQHWPEKAIQNLGDICQQNIIDDLKQAIKQLDTIIYKSGQQQFNGTALWQAFVENEKQKSKTKESNNDVPPLHLQ